MSSARFQSTCRGSSAVSPKWRRLSIAAASRLWRGGDRVEVAGELEVDRVRGLDPARPAAGRPPLRPKTGPIDGCRSAIADVLADLPQPLRQADRGRRLALAGRGRGDRRDEDQLPRRPIGRARSSASSRTFALSRPYGSRWSAAIPRSRATSAIGRRLGACGGRACRHRGLHPHRSPGRSTGRSGSRGPANNARSTGRAARSTADASEHQAEQRPRREGQVFDQGEQRTIRGIARRVAEVHRAGEVARLAATEEEAADRAVVVHREPATRRPDPRPAPRAARRRIGPDAGGCRGNGDRSGVSIRGPPPGLQVRRQPARASRATRRPGSPA